MLQIKPSTTVRTQAGNLHEGDTNKRNTWRRVNETTGWSKQETDSRVRLFHGSGLWKKLSGPEKLYFANDEADRSPQRTQTPVCIDF